MAKSGLKPRPLEARFWEKVDKRGPDECWEWKGSKTKTGYGRINNGTHSGSPLRAHRVSWEIHNGPIPEGKYVLHRCDNPGCVNPRHLWIGSQADNIRDMDRKGRRKTVSRKGEGNGNAKLTRRTVCKIRGFLDAGYSLRQIASMFNIHYSTVHDIKTRKSWGWLD